MSAVELTTKACRELVEQATQNPWSQYWAGVRVHCVRTLYWVQMATERAREDTLLMVLQAEYDAAMGEEDGDDLRDGQRYAAISIWERVQDGLTLAGCG